MCPFSWAFFYVVAIGNNGKIVLGVQGLAPDKAQEKREAVSLV